MPDYPRVTTIIKRSFPIDFSHVPKEVLDNAISFGNATHKMVELYLKGTLRYNTLDKTLSPYLDQFKKWKQESKIEIIGVENRLSSEKYKFKGTPDMFGKIKGRLCIVDLKTTATISKTIGLQLSAYEILAKEFINTNIVNCNRYVLRLFPNKYEFIPITGKRDMSAFLACLNVYNYTKEIGYEQPNNS